MFNLEYHLSTEKMPDHDSNICYYVLNDNPYLHKSVHQTSTSVRYEWCSDCGEVEEYYNPKTESHYTINDTRVSCFPDDENESHRTVRLTLFFGSDALWLNLPEEVAKFAWNYTHDVQREVSKYQEGGESYFPCFDINNLLREGVVDVLSFDKVLVGEAGNQYFHVYTTVMYKDGLFHLKLSQDSKWEDDDWVLSEDGSINFGRVDIFLYEYLGGSCKEGLY